jgi:transcriptional regulator with XRE-family HTH domain
MSVMRDLRRKAGMTQAEVAAAAGTSQPAIAAYESERKSPTMRTLRRIADALGFELTVGFVPPLTREDRRSLALHRAIVDKLLTDPVEVTGKARANLQVMRDRHHHASPLLEEWEGILGRSVEEIVEVLLDPGVHARELRHVTPFAGVLSPVERSKVFAEFRRAEQSR